MKRIVICLFIFMWGLILMCEADLEKGDTARKFKSSFDGSEQPYRFFVPSSYDNGKPYPLLVVLHGKWVDQNAWFDYTPVKNHAEKEGYVVAAPFGRGDYFYRGAAEQDVLDIISEAKKLCNIDSARVYLMGHSMGGWGTWWIGLRNPDLFAAICPMAGMCPFDLIKNAEHLNPFIIHDEDDPIVPVSNSREPLELLAVNGISFRYKEEHGYGHASKMIGDNFDELFNWLNANRLNQAPGQIIYTTRTPFKGKAYWTNILETFRFPKYASVDARVDKKDKILVKTENVKRLLIDISKSPAASSGKISIIIDDYGIKAASGAEKVFLVRESADGVWREAKDKGEQETLYTPEVVADIPKDSDEATSSTFLTDAASKLLIGELGVDFCLLKFDMFQFPGGKLTAEGALDLYVYPEERLALFEYKGEPIPEFLNAMPEFFPRTKYKDFVAKFGKDATFKAVAPIDVANKMKVKYKTLPDVMGESLLKAIKNNGNSFYVK